MRVKARVSRTESGPTTGVATTSGTSTQPGPTNAATVSLPSVEVRVYFTIILCVGSCTHFLVYKFGVKINIFCVIPGNGRWFGLGNPFQNMQEGFPVETT